MVVAWSSTDGWHEIEPPRVETNAGRFRFVWSEEPSQADRGVVCADCGTSVYPVTDDNVAMMAGGTPVAVVGDWACLITGVSCPESDGGKHRVEP